jgi:AhpD family alkylhydroperoxidase
MLEGYAMSHQRLDLRATAPDAYAAVSGVERHIRSCGLEKSLIELVKMRASQINHCAYCLDMHSRDARQNGETEQRLYVLSAWRESPLYNARERAALAWTECLTKVATDGAPDDVYAAVQAQFSPKEIVELTILVGLINLWNRLAIGMNAQHRLDEAA